MSIYLINTRREISMKYRFLTTVLMAVDEDEIAANWVQCQMYIRFVCWFVACWVRAERVGNVENVRLFHRNQSSMRGCDASYRQPCHETLPQLLFTTFYGSLLTINIKCTLLHKFTSRVLHLIFIFMNIVISLTYSCKKQ